MNAVQVTTASVHEWKKNNSKNAEQDKSVNIRESINNKMNAEQVITTSTPESTKNTFILLKVWPMDIIESINSKMNELQLH